MDMSGLSEADRLRMMRLIEEKQMKDSMRLYNSLVERCFMDCIGDFTSKSLSSKEELCMNKCADKFFKHSARVGERFQEHQAALMQQQQEQQSQASQPPSSSF